MKIKECELSARPREKAARFGLGSLSDQELLCLLLGSGTKTKPVERLAQELLDTSRNLSGLMDLQPQQLMEISGIGLAKAMMVGASLELARRSLQASAMSSPVGSLEQIIRWFQAEYGTKAQEHFAAVYIDSKGNILKHKLLFIGTLNQSIVHPRDVFREAYGCNASGVLFVHNHPSNDPCPSIADLEATQMLCQAAEVCGIDVVDHLIVGRSTVFSFRAHDLLVAPGEEEIDESMMEL